MVESWKKAEDFKCFLLFIVCWNGNRLGLLCELLSNNSLFVSQLFDDKSLACKVSKGAKIRNQYNQVPHLTQDTNGKVTTHS